MVPILDVLADLGGGRRLQQGWSPQCENESSSSERDWAVLKTTAVQDGSFLDFENKKLPRALEPRPQLEVQQGDVLLTCAGPRSRCGVATLVRATRPRLMISGKLYRFRANPQLMLSEFLEAFLRSPETQAVIDGMKTGMSESGMNLTHERFSGLQVPVPPLDKQRRIVAKLDELLAQSRAAREQLEAVPALVEQYRQSVLASAFRGGLTKEWRAKYPDVEPASKLLERIRAERRRQWEAAELAKMKAKGKAPKDDKWKAKYEEPAPVDVSGLPELPSTWCWAAVEELCPFDAPAVYGIIQAGPHVERGVPYIRPLDIDAEGQVRIDELNRTSRQIADEYERAMLAPGDVVLSIVGTIGKVFVVPPELDGANITQSSIRIRPPKGMATAYMQRLLQSPVMRRQYDQYRFGNAVQRLNVEHVRRLAVPVAPERESNALIHLLEPRLAQVGDAARAVGGVDVGQLERSLLAKAFRGEFDLHGTDGEVVRLQEAAAGAAEKGRGGRRTA